MPKLDPHEAADIWEGMLEPSHIVHFRVHEPGTEYGWAAEIVRDHGLPAVLIFTHGPGPDSIQRFQLPGGMKAEVIAQAAHRLGVRFGTIDLRTREFLLPATGTGHGDEVTGLALDVGAEVLPVQRGWCLLGRQDHASWSEVPRPMPTEAGSYIVTMLVGGSRSMRARLGVAAE